MISTWISDFDMACFAFFGNRQSDVLTGIAKLFSLDSHAVLLGCGALLVILCLFRRTRRIGLSLLAAVLLGYLLADGIIKPLVGRLRPFDVLSEDPLFQVWYRNMGEQITSAFSFPSGHTTIFSAVAAVLLIFHAVSERKAAKAIAFLFPVIAILSGASRVYLMVHYATDVLGSFLVGTAAGLGGYFLIAAFGRWRRHFPDDQNTKEQVGQK